MLSNGVQLAPVQLLGSERPQFRFACIGPDERFVVLLHQFHERCKLSQAAPALRGTPYALNCLYVYHLRLKLVNALSYFWGELTLHSDWSCMPRSETEHALAQLLARLLETRLSKHTPTPTKPHAMVTSGSVHMCVYTTIDEAVESGETCLRRQPLTWMYSLHSTEGRQAGRYSVPKPRSVFSVPTRTVKASIGMRVPLEAKCMGPSPYR